GVAAAVRMAQAAGSGTQRHTGFDGPITTVIIVRHGMSVDTGRDVFAGNVVPGPSLSPDGLAQAQAASREIRRMIDVPWFGLHAPVGAIASPTARTMETAAELAAPWGLEIGTDAGFIEQNFGEWDGLTALQVRDRWPGGVERWASDPDYHPGDGESRREVGDRVKAALTQVVDRWCGRCVLIASHAVATRAAIGAALGAPPEAWASFRIAPASINVLRFWASGPTEVVCTNRTV
ncbi:MAG: histidine phosphatase family protein, partial [Bifidobacteriaceae bacterium]|nr:histidine phosphatase family protein [Bifidobacteriaceae bacterium]